jgi:hypothetical protein
MKRMDDGRLDVSEDSLELSESRREIAFERACKVAGIDIEHLECAEEAMLNEVFVAEFEAELCRMIRADDMAQLRGEGLVEAYVNPETGELGHVLTAAGEAHFG